MKVYIVNPESLKTQEPESFVWLAELSVPARSAMKRLMADDQRL